MLGQRSDAGSSRAPALRRAGASGATPIRESLEASTPEILRRAEALAIPWERLLRDEIEAEEALRRRAAVADAEMPLATALTILPSSFLRSWRLRDQIQSLSCEARGASFRKAVRELRMVFRCLIGQSGRGPEVFSAHLWLAYQRVLLLQRASRAARRSSGTTAERLAFVCSATHCSFDDSAWAVCREDAPRPGHRLDAAIRKARDEGFQIPRAATEARAFAKLRRIVNGSPRTGPRRRPASHLASVPQRVALLVDAT